MAYLVCLDAKAFPVYLELRVNVDRLAPRVNLAILESPA